MASLSLGVLARLVRTLSVGLLLYGYAESATVVAVRSGSGADPASIQGVVDLFRMDLGDPNNLNVPGSQPGGRREINWDGGGAAANALIVPSPFTNFSFRGNISVAPGFSFEQSGQPSPEFGDINPTYPDIFQTFSSPRLFSVLGTNAFDVLFTQPGTTNIPALTTGFGAVFTDVDLADTSSLEFFDIGGMSLGEYFVPTANNGLSFLGVVFDEAVVFRVRITTGNTALGPSELDGVDVVVLDDFLYGEPQAIPEPATIFLLSGSAALIFLRKRALRRALR